MKKITFLLILLLTIQNTEAQGFGFDVGVNFPKFKATYTGNDVFNEGETKTFPKVRIGVNYDVPFNDNFYLNCGLAYSPKGHYQEIDKTTNEEGIRINNNGYEKYLLNYIEIPIQAKYIGGSDDLKFYGKFGPYLAFAVGGKGEIKSTTTIPEYPEFNTEYSETDDDIIGNDKDENLFKAFDFGIGLGAGVNYNGIDFSINYSLGLSNISIQDKTEVKNKTFSLSLGYRFN